jgi:hypothetical protein
MSYKRSSRELMIEYTLVRFVGLLAFGHNRVGGQIRGIRSHETP